jgi:RimJ/RimL family protein N-acetyltransferase
MDETVTIRPWSEGDLPVLEANNAPEMMGYLGGPETAEKLARRHRVFLDGWADDTAWLFVVLADDEPVGSVGYWLREHDGDDAFEAGWAIQSAHQGKGYGAAALRLCIADARDRATAERHWLYAYPRTDNAPSNRIAEKVGMTNTGELPFEYPKGVPIVTNAWRIDLLA